MSCNNNYLVKLPEEFSNLTNLELLDPSRRKGQVYGPGEYFGKDIGTSLLYCKGGKIVLIFVILNEKDGITYESDYPPHNLGQKILVINKTEYQLPIGYITL